MGFIVSAFVSLFGWGAVLFWNVEPGWAYLLGLAVGAVTAILRQPRGGDF